MPTPSVGGRDARRDKNDVARRVTSASMDEGMYVDSRAAFHRCRSAISQRLRFYRERGSGMGTSGSERVPPARAEFPRPRRWLEGMPLCSLSDQAGGTTRPWRHLRRAWLFPCCVVRVRLCSGGGDRARRHYATGPFLQDLVRQERGGETVMEPGKTSRT